VSTGKLHPICGFFRITSDQIREHSGRVAWERGDIVGNVLSSVREKISMSAICLKNTRLAVATGAILIGAGVLPAAAGVKVGVLQCQVGAGVGLIVLKEEKLVCTFHSNTGASEHYHGHMTKVGLEVGVTGGSIIVWAVAAATNDYKAGSLAGEYAGISADATAVYGVGANALVGGSAKSIALQPLSVQGQVGIDIGLGIGAMSLKPR
jgi:hypothetical protein